MSLLESELKADIEMKDNEIEDLKSKLRKIKEIIELEFRR